MNDVEPGGYVPPPEVLWIETVTLWVLMVASWLVYVARRSGAAQRGRERIVRRLRLWVRAAGAPFRALARLVRSTRRRLFVRRARRRRGRFLDRCRKAYVSTLPPIGRGPRNPADLRRSVSPFAGESLGVLGRLAGFRRDGRSVMFDLMGYYRWLLRPLVTTTHQVEAVWPIVGEPPWTEKGPLVGFDELTGEEVHYGGHEMYDQGLTGINMLVLGDQGFGKSGFAKRYAKRLVGHGGQVVVFDSKAQQSKTESGGFESRGEWVRLAKPLGGTVLRFSRESGLRVNPIDPRIARDVALAAGMVGRVEGGSAVGVVDPGEKQAQAVQGVIGQDSLLRTIVQQSRGDKRPLTDREDFALRLALTGAHRVASSQDRVAILFDVYEALWSPSEEEAASYKIDLATLKAWGEGIALTLLRAIEGDLGGFLNGETSPEIRFDSDFIVFDLSDVDAETDALPVIMAVLGAFLRNAWLRPDGKRRTLIIDEGWNILMHEPIARMFRRLWKLPRALGLENIAVVHRLGDIPGFFDSSSAARSVVKEANVKVLFHLAAGSIGDVVREFRLNDEAADEVQRLTMDHAVWLVGDKPPRRVFMPPTALEWQLTDTHSAMRSALDDEDDEYEPLRLASA